MADLVVAAGALPAAGADLRRHVDALDRALDDADHVVAVFATSWTGDAAGIFGATWVAWRDAAAALRSNLVDLRVLLDISDANHVSVQRATVRAWSATASALSGVADAPPWVTLSTPEIVVAARDSAGAQDAVAAAAGRGGLEASAGFAGDDDALSVWRGRYDAMARRAWDAVEAGVSIFGGMAVGLTDTANAWVEADESAVPGGRPGERLPAPAVLRGLAGPGPAPATGPGIVGPVPDEVAAYWPDVDAARVDEVGDAWRAIGDAVTRAVVVTDRALIMVRRANQGPVFDAIDRYWAGVQGPGSGGVLDLATRVPGVLATTSGKLAEIVRETQREIGDAIAHLPIGDDHEETYRLLQAAKHGARLLGAVGRVGTGLTDAAETGLRVHLARRRYEERVAQLVLEMDQRLIGQLVDATREPRTVESVAPQFAPPPNGVGDIPLPPLTFDRTQLEEKFRKHFDDFDLPDNSARSRRAYEERILALAADPDNLHVRGTYRGNRPVIFHLEPTTGLTVLQESGGRFLSAWRLNLEQLTNVLERQSL